MIITKLNKNKLIIAEKQNLKNYDIKWIKIVARQNKKFY